MSVYITPQDELHVEHEGIALTCPQCQTLTHITAAATPRFDDLSRRKPKQVGIVFRCDACGEPIFLKFNAKGYTALRIELAANYTEIERAREKFPLTYLPAEAEDLFRELGEQGKLELFDTLQEIRTLAELDDDTFGTLRAVLFGSDSDPWPHQPNLDGESAGVLLEVMRDLLYQTFVRKARLLQAMTYRKHVAPIRVETGT